MQKYTYLIIINFSILFLFSENLFAQMFTTSVDAQISVPQQDYTKANPDAGFGIRANFLYAPEKTVPVKIGLELGMQEKGRQSQYFSGIVYGFYEEFKVSATNNIFSLV